MVSQKIIIMMKFGDIEKVIEWRAFIHNKL